MVNKLILWAFIFYSATATGQTFIMNGSPIASCSGTFFDGGGSNGNYNNNQNLHTAICPDGLGGSHVRLSFDSMVLAPGDQLCIHDGANVLAPLLACASDFPNNQAFQIQASAGNASGCLTLSFISDASGTAAGWSAGISCSAPCVVAAPTNVLVASMNNGNMRWTWNPVPGSSGFEVNVNGGSWQAATEAQAHTVTGLVSGDLVIIEIRPISSNPGCSVESITANRSYANCTLDASLLSQSPVVCPGGASGSAVIATSGAMGTVQFFVDNNPVPFPNGNFNNFFSAGPHQVIVLDTAGCRDTVSFTITEPPPLSVSIAVTDAKCFGDNSGILQGNTTGGTPGYLYAWRNCQGGPILTGATVPDLFAGCYSVTVTDSQGCTAVAQDTIGEPPKFQFSSIQDSVRCFGGMDGKATVFVSGAIPPYTYLWGNGDKTQMADSLKAAFHSVTITDAVGCQAVTLVQVLQPTRLLIDSVTTTSITCFGINNGTATVFAKGGSKPYSYAWSNALTGVTVMNLGPGTYTVTLTDFKGCTASANTSLSAPPELLAQLTNIQNESCAGACNGSMTLTTSGGAPPYTIVWNPATVPPGTTMPSQLCPGIYTVQVTDSKGCTRSSTATIQAATPFSVQLSATAPSCAGGQNGQIIASGMGGASPFQYLWNTGATGGTIQNLSCGIYTVSVTDAQNCTITASDTLPCAPALLIDSIQSKPVRCFGEANGQASIFAKGGTGTLTYLWSDPNQQFDPTAVNLPPGVYTVTVTDANNCTITASTTVIEPPVLSATIAPTHVSCFGGNNGAATATPSGGVPPYLYAWSIPQLTPTISNLSAGVYSVTVTDSYGCPSGGISVQINQPATPVMVSATQTRWACYDSNNGEALASASGSNGPPFTYVWSSGFNGPAPGNFTSGNYTVTATDQLGCTGTQSVTISEWDSIHVNVAFVLPSCKGSNDGQAAVNLVSGGSGNGVPSNYSFHWSKPGAPDTIYINGLSGNQNYGLTVTDNSGCSASFSYFLADQSPILPALKADSISCFGLANGAIKLTGIQAPLPITMYAWSNGSNSQDLTSLAPGTYTLTVTDSKGCTGSASATVIEPTAIKIQLAIQSLACNNDLNGSVQANVQGGTPGYLYLWNTGVSNKKIENLGPGQYTVTVSDSKGCTAIDNTVLSQPNPPVVTLELKAPNCSGQKNGSAKVVLSGGTMPYRFSLDGQTFTGSSTFLGLAAGNYTAYVLDGLGCTTSAAFSLTEPPPIEVDLGPDQSIILGDSVLISADVFHANGLVQYSWNSALVDSFRCADPPLCTSIWVFPQYSNRYSVLATDENGCRGEATLRVEVEKPRGLYVPTGFSPNSDGNNDLLVVYGKSRQIKLVNVFRVYDRWGELVYEDFDFQVNNEQRGWNGIFRDKDAQTGVYVWYAEVEYIDGFSEVVRGNTTLIR